MQPAATILIVKSGISNHAASGILDELCLSKFGTFHAACPQPADNGRTHSGDCPNVERHSIRCRTRHGRTTWILLQRIRRCRLHWNVMVPSFFVYSLSPVRFPGCRGLSNTVLPVWESEPTRTADVRPSISRSPRSPFPS